MMVKGLAKLVVKDYNDHTNTYISGIQVTDEKGKKQLFGELFAGKTVYLYVWKDKKNRPPADQEKTYHALQQRFAKYPDVVFANLYLGSDTAANSYQLVNNASSEEFRRILKLNEKAPFIIGKDGSILAYKGPKPGDNIVVDYVLFEARNGMNGTKAAKKLIRGVNGDEEFKSPELQEWYTNHFNKAPEGRMSFSISSTH
ncbi:hypothetical protein AQF98_13105 [Pedobacter sp. Hv1]|nr:hypothetical protein AQF98_13105 [Pedobacter sp. Hv1]